MNIKYSLIISISLLFCFQLNAQFLHTPTNIEELMNQSSVKYTVINGQIEASKKQLPIIDRISNGSFEVNSSSIKKLYKKANKAIAKSNYEKAEALLTEILSKDRQNNYVKEDLADIFLKHQKYNPALGIYKQLSQDNPFDFDYHFKLAQCYLQLGDIANAKTEITLAHLYNRNHSDIYGQMKAIFKQADLVYLDWTFDPIYQLETSNDKNISITASNKIWEAYANCKAVWLYEPDYVDKMQHLSTNAVHIIEEKECLFNTILAYEISENKADFPEMKGLAKALQMDIVDSFIIYEKVLRENPEIILNFKPSEIDELIFYINKVHVELIEQ